MFVPVELVIIEALPGPREHDQRGDPVVPRAQPPYVAHDMGVVPGQRGPIERDDLGPLARAAGLPRRHPGGSDSRMIMHVTAIWRIGVPPLEEPTRMARHG
jgi:hypothetical protein